MWSGGSAGLEWIEHSPLGPISGNRINGRRRSMDCKVLIHGRGIGEEYAGIGGNPRNSGSVDDVMPLSARESMMLVMGRGLVSEAS